MVARAHLLALSVAVLGCSADRIAGLGDESDTGESGAMAAPEPGEIVWTYEVDLHPELLEATPDGLLVGGSRLEILDDDEWPGFEIEAEVFALDHDGARVWTSVWSPEQITPASIHALAWDPQGVWVGFDKIRECIDWCPGSWLARLDSTGVELWRIELSNTADTWTIRPIDADAIVVGAGDGSPGAEVRRIDPSGTLIWEWVFDADSQSLFTTGVELFDSALWVIGQTQHQSGSDPWIARLDPQTGVLLEVVDTLLPSGAAWWATALPTGLAVITDGRLWVLDGVGDWVWTRGLPPTWPFGCWFDARVDGLSASACERAVEVLDPHGQPYWSFDPDDGPKWSDVAIGDRLYLAGGDDPGRIYALQID